MMEPLRSNTFVYATLCFIFMMIVFLAVEYDQTLELVVSSASKKLVFSKAPIATTASARKLLDYDVVGDMNRVGTSTCSRGDIVIFQGPTAPLPNGIPTYTVQVHNVCVSGCSISNIHLSCGWFSSARLINPSLFRRIYYDDCLVNNGDALGPGESLSFQYANSFEYPMSVSSVVC